MIKQLENPCRKNCMSCTKYKTVKEMNQNCETKKERKRAINRDIYRLKKQAKKEMQNL